MGKRGGDGWDGSEGKRVSGSFARSHPQKTEEAVDHRQNNNYVKAVGTLPVRSSLCAPLIAISNAVWSRVTMTVFVTQLLRNN